MKLEIEITYASGETVTLPVTARVEVELERRFDLALAECRRREHVYFAAWTALRLAGRLETRESGRFDDWLDTVASAEFASTPEADEPRPTQAVAGSGTS